MLFRIAYKCKELLSHIKWFFQKIIRPHHCSDLDLWGLDIHFAQIILPKLKAFRKYPLHGHPISFCDYSEDDGAWTKEEYDKYKKSGDIVGGGHEAWLKTIDEMIFAMEFILIDGCCASKTLEKRFKKKYGDWHEKKPENKCNTNWGNDPEFKEMVDNTFYYDSKLHKKMIERCQKGLELFGKYFSNLWD